MSDVSVTPDAPAIVMDPSSSKPLVPAPAPAAAAPAEDKYEWLAPRLERERKALLKELGVDNVDTARKAIATAKAAEAAAPAPAKAASEGQTDALARQIKTQSEVFGVLAKDQLAALTEEQRTAVAAVAGDDPALQLKTISALRPTWASAAAPAATAQPAAPKDTATAPSAPKDGVTTQSPPDLKAMHADYQKTNPVFAARFALANGLFDKK